MNRHPRSMVPSDFHKDEGGALVSAVGYVVSPKDKSANIISSDKDGQSETEMLLPKTIANGTASSHSSRSHTLESISGHSKNASLFSYRAVVLICVWYFFSFTTLFMNKYILSYQKGDPTALGAFQLLMCAFCGYFHLRFPCGLYKKTKKEKKPSSFVKNVVAVGTLRFTTIVFGLIALWYVPVSFAETVKSSAPVFTVIISRLIIGEKTSWLVNISLLPVMGGLALCSANELSFSTAGFIASLATNLSECFQNVFSKLLLSGEKYRYEPPELQFYTSIASIGVQIPACLILINFQEFYSLLNRELVLAFLLDGLSFHCQSLTEYMLLGLISPVTHSVANTAKRALLIWLSVLTFGNPVTFLSGLGTATVIFGVLFYNKARELSRVMPVLAASPVNQHQV